MNIIVAIDQSIPMYCQRPCTHTFLLLLAKTPKPSFLHGKTILGARSHRQYRPGGTEIYHKIYRGTLPIGKGSGTVQSQPSETPRLVEPGSGFSTTSPGQCIDARPRHGTCTPSLPRLGHSWSFRAAPVARLFLRGARARPAPVGSRLPVVAQGWCHQVPGEHRTSTLMLGQRQWTFSLLPHHNRLRSIAVERTRLHDIRKGERE